MIRYETIASGAEGPAVLLTAGVHGDEYEPILAAMRLRKLLEKKLIRGKVTIVPVVNESAFKAGSRCGADGLDLARICPGDAGGSASEKEAARISGLIRNADFLVDLHTGGVLYDIFPLAGYMLVTDPVILDRQRQMAHAFNLPVVWGTDSRPEGRTLSIARDARVPAIYLEYGGGTGIRPYVTDAYVSGFLNLLAELRMVDSEPDTQPAAEAYWVEDYRDNSGYLQGKMPAPAEGIFVAEVKTGDFVRSGQQWGTIVSPSGAEAVPVFADLDGLAFLMRNSVYVRPGDALGGILPITEKGKVVIRD